MIRWRELKAVWRVGMLTPRLTWGWAGLILELGLLRWCGQFPGWAVGQVALVVLLLANVVWQFRQVAQSYRATPFFQRGWRVGLAWSGLLVSLVGLALPWGLWGLGSRFLVRLKLPAAWVNDISLYRHPLLGAVAVVYLVLVAYSLIWGPQHWRLTTVIGTPRQMLQGLGWLAGLMLSWGMMSGALVVGNWAVDQWLSPSGATAFALGSLSLILAGYTMASLLGTVTLIWCWCGQPAVAVPRMQRSRWSLGGLVLVWVVISGAVIVQAWQMPRFLATTVISHRGLDAGVGVQNTLGALRHTKRLHPQYVEMDLHETRDHRWVVLHDENLKTLAHRNVTPHQLTQAQLSGLTLRENGQRGRLVSWPKYLKTAERLHQPLLVELKTTPTDSRGMVRRFAHLYGARLRRDHSAVHSLDYRVVAQLRRVAPRLRVGFITPFNWVDPASAPADFYSFQQRSLSDQFILAAHRQGAATYLWTPDATTAMSRAWALGVDGQITDQAGRLQRVVAQRPNRVFWAIVANFTLSYI